MTRTRLLWLLLPLCLLAGLIPPGARCETAATPATTTATAEEPTPPEAQLPEVRVKLLKDLQTQMEELLPIIDKSQDPVLMTKSGAAFTADFCKAVSIIDPRLDLNPNATYTVPDMKAFAPFDALLRKALALPRMQVSSGLYTPAEAMGWVTDKRLLEALMTLIDVGIHTNKWPADKLPLYQSMRAAEYARYITQTKREDLQPYVKRLLEKYPKPKPAE